MTLQHFSRALLTPDLSLAMLADARPVTEPNGMPRLVRTTRFAEAEVEWRGERWLVAMPLNPSAMPRIERTVSALRKLNTGYLAECRILPGEMRWHDAAGTERHTELVLQHLPAGREFAEALLAEDKTTLLAALDALQAALGELEFTHNNLKEANLRWHRGRFVPIRYYDARIGAAEPGTADREAFDVLRHRIAEAPVPRQTANDVTVPSQPLLAAAVLVAGHFGWFASAYLLVETRFLTNFNERLLQQYGDSNDATWLDEKMYVTELICPPEEAGKDLRALGWGRRYGANIIKIVRGKKEFDIPSGDMVLSEGDRLAVIGEKENLVSLRLSIGADAAEDIPTLHTYIAGEKALYTYTLDVAKNDHLAGSTIRDSGLRENYDCMILGLQRNLLPIIGPDVNFVIQRGDLVWLLGSHRMAEKALDDMEEA